jgi:hypothetical protein
MRFSLIAKVLILPMLWTAAALPAAPAASAVPAATATPDTGPWQAFLDRYLDAKSPDGINRVRYAAVTPGDKAALAKWLEAMQAGKPSALPGDAQRAYWINLYNAQTVSVVLQAYPVKSIRDIKPPGSSNGPWDAKALTVEGRELSLNDIENGILRTRWKDYRIHFALNCASLGCPDLSPRAFAAATLEARLDQGMRDFLKSPRALAFTAQGLRLSSLFDWYKGDFGKTDKEVLEILAKYAPAETGARLRAFTGKIEYQYDWTLNDAKAAERR